MVARQGKSGRTDLLRWYARSHRDLPWRRTRDAYRVWVSEIMLQQTRVETVLSYYERFLARFPDVRTLADAPIDDVLSLWSGLGYYRRARLLHQAAAEVVREHEGSFPRALAAACELPGIGRSTAGAICSISYGERAPVLDGNVKRVLVRLHALRGDPDSRAVMSRLWELAQEFVDCDEAGDVNQALMELGATTCLPFAAARCERCPLQAVCRSRALGLVEALPEKSARAALVPRTWAVAIARKGDRFLLHQRDPKGLLHGMVEFPTIELAEPGDALSRDSVRDELAAFLRDRFGARPVVGPELLRHRQVISNLKVTQRAFEVTLNGKTSSRARWLEPARIDGLPITMATRKILARVLQGAPSLFARPPLRARGSVR